MSAIDQLQSLSTLLESIKDDADKHNRGQKAAGVRIRAAMQDVKTLAGTIRAEVLAEQKANKG